VEPRNVLSDADVRELRLWALSQSPNGNTARAARLVSALLIERADLRRQLDECAKSARPRTTKRATKSAAKTKRGKRS
jgi:hypothetical protein